MLDFHHIPEADIYTPLDLAVDLTQDYPGRGGVEVFSSMKLNTQYLILDSEDKLKTEVYSQYFEKLAQSLLSTSDGLVEVKKKAHTKTNKDNAYMYLHFFTSGGINKSAREFQVTTFAPLPDSVLEKCVRLQS